MSVEQARHTREQVSFPSGDTQCGAWLYTPSELAAGQTAPVVILGHGLGATIELGLDPYAAAFADAGMLALAFDYRHFGISGGQPRQLLDIGRQLGDWRAAIAFVRSLAAVDASRIALFGSSFGGGHVIQTAADQPEVAAVIAQCPFTDGLRSSLTLGIASTLKVSARAGADLLAGLTGKGPVLVPLAGAPHSAALMTAPDVMDGYWALVPPGLDFTNGVAARVALRIPLYRPGRAAARVKAPILFCVCDRDTVAPAPSTLRYAAGAPNAEVIRYPIGHFDIYKGAAFERAVADQLDFLKRHLL